MRKKVLISYANHGYGYDFLPHWRPPRDLFDDGHPLPEEEPLPEWKEFATDTHLGFATDDYGPPGHQVWFFWHKGQVIEAPMAEDCLAPRAGEVGRRRISSGAVDASDYLIHVEGVWYSLPCEFDQLTRVLNEDLDPVQLIIPHKGDITVCFCRRFGSPDWGWLRPPIIYDGLLDEDLDDDEVRICDGLVVDDWQLIP